MGHPPSVAAADSGFHNDAAIQNLPPRRRRSSPPRRVQKKANTDASARRVEMAARLRTETGKRLHAERGKTVEPAFGHLKHDLGYRQFHHRGKELVNTEWVTMLVGFNLLRLWKLTRATSRSGA